MLSASWRTGKHETGLCRQPSINIAACVYFDISSHFDDRRTTNPDQIWWNDMPVPWPGSVVYLHARARHPVSTQPPGTGLTRPPWGHLCNTELILPADHPDYNISSSSLGLLSLLFSSCPLSLKSGCSTFYEQTYLKLCRKSTSYLLLYLQRGLWK